MLSVLTIFMPEMDEVAIVCAVVAITQQCGKISLSLITVIFKEASGSYLFKLQPGCWRGDRCRLLAMPRFGRPFPLRSVLRKSPQRNHHCRNECDQPQQFKCSRQGFHRSIGLSQQASNDKPKIRRDASIR